MFPMDRKSPVTVVIEYDSRGKRVTKTLSSEWESKSFYVKMFKAGKNPKILSATR